MRQQHETYVVLVPKPGTQAYLHIDGGSGIVADATKWAADPTVTVYYEGNRFAMSNLQEYEERIKCAAGRLQQRYPTIARGVFPTSEFTEVGTFVFAADWTMDALSITDKDAVAQWVQP